MGQSGIFLFLENNSHVRQLSKGYFLLESSEIFLFFRVNLHGIPLPEVKISIIDCLNRKNTLSSGTLFQDVLLKFVTEWSISWIKFMERIHFFRCWKKLLLLLGFFSLFSWILVQLLEGVCPATFALLYLSCSFSVFKVLLDD